MNLINGPITENKINEAAKSLKNNKSLGIDEILIELIKASVPHTCAPSEDSDQPGHLSLRWAHSHFVGSIMRWLICPKQNFSQ